MLKVGVSWPGFKPNLWDLGPVLLKLLDSLEVKISLSQKELIFKLFLGTAVCSRSGEAAIPQLPAASRAGSESVFNFVPDSHLIYAILPLRASTNWRATKVSFSFSLLYRISCPEIRFLSPPPPPLTTPAAAFRAPRAAASRQNICHTAPVPFHGTRIAADHPIPLAQIKPTSIYCGRPPVLPPTAGRWPAAPAAGLSSLTCIRPAVTPLSCCLLVALWYSCSPLVLPGAGKRAACSIDLS
jgi:hypothetical protein